MDKNTRINTAAKNTLAKALYDNKAECSDELGFRKGDILTVLDQNVIGSEGWWKCSLHGRQGLAPANRLQLLAGLQAGMLSPPCQHDSQELPSNQPNIYQVPKAPKSTVSSSVYEQMDGWVKPSPTVFPLPTQEVYQVPALSAQLFNEKTHILTNQHLLTLPRVSQASASNIQSYVYDVPSPQRQESLLAQMYDVPPTRERDIPIQNTSQRKYVGHCNTLPNPRKSEWIYDIPVSPEKPSLKQYPLNHSLEKQILYDVPPARYGAGVQNAASTIPATATEGKLVNPQEYDVPPIQKKLTFPDAPLYAVPSSRDMLRLRKNGNYHVPPSFLTAKVENQNCEQNIYDIPKVLPTALQNRKGTEKNNGSFEDHTYNVPLQLSRDAKLEQDTLSFDSVDSRTSTISTSSSTSVESFSLSSEEEPAQEIKLDLDVAIEMLTKLQHSVSSSVASLMIFVSSKWRYQEHLEANIEEIHRAVDHIKVSLGEFLNFAQGIKANASCLSDNNLQTRIKKQLQILVDSFHILVETREALNNCNWSLQVLVIKKPQNNPDDLDRFVMVARAIPDDIRRFVSIIIANGKLLFKKNDKEQKTTQPKLNTEHKMAKPVLAPRRREFNSLQRNKPNKSELSSEKSRKNVSEDRDYDHLQKYQGLEQAAKHLSPKEVATKNGDSKQKVIPEKPVQNKQDSSKKTIFSENCRLCFGALQKAIGVFTNSLSNNQPPEVFIGHSKLIIMIGQKLVDSLCQETQEKDTRNDILHSSSQFCSLLKNLALATKNAAVQYPNTDAVKELLGQADTLSKYTQQFQDTME
ncbi:PREDICTED: cas scaffolding protein family member 4 isoform X2 [Gavialis gangeticus]|uniref:cas scaffolding protein family member 4 isoform X2 n=1 Tax=Gavialis gangeticus TaxID=94835 RepID=UPI00092E7F1A|nr:PREDICTED: cas scaffolding protein family member 4 isoform X2 [Gavialis gangeticus]